MAPVNPSQNILADLPDWFYNWFEEQKSWFIPEVVQRIISFWKRKQLIKAQIIFNQ